MGNLREKQGLVGIMMIISIVIILMIERSMAVQHYVGGRKFGWVPGVNLSQWSAAQYFYVYEWLFFGFDKNQNNVLEVNKTSYENCIATNFIFNVTRGGRDVFELKEAKKYYFIDGRGFCYNGLKLMVDVHRKPLPPPPSPPPANGGAASRLRSKFHSSLSWLLPWLCILSLYTRIGI